MRGAACLAIGVSGAVVAGLGLACLNYTKASTIEHHLAWAAAHGMPAPGDAILLAGAASLALGVGAIGFALGRWSA